VHEKVLVRNQRNTMCVFK